MKTLFENEFYTIGIEQHNSKVGVKDDKFNYRINIKTSLYLKKRQGCDRDHYTSQDKGLDFAKEHADHMIKEYFRLPTDKELISSSTLQSSYPHTLIAKA